MTPTADFEDRVAARILGVDVDADPGAIRAQFRRLALSAHPDTAVGTGDVDLGRLAAAKQRLIARAEARTTDVGRWAERERRLRAGTAARARMVRIRRQQEVRRRLEQRRAVADLTEPCGSRSPSAGFAGAGVPRRRSASAGRIGPLVDLAV